MMAVSSKQSQAAMGRMFPTRNDLPEGTRRQVVALLNQQVADYIDLYSQIKHAHWNVKGPDFIGLHKLLDELAELVEESIDEVAERAVTLGGVAVGTVRAVAGATRLTEYPADVHLTRNVAGVMADRFAEAGKTTRTAIDKADGFGDKDTADLFTGVSRTLDKSTWLLEAHVQIEG